MSGVARSLFSALAFENTALADPPAPLTLPTGQELVDEFFGVTPTFESEDALEKKDGKRKKGRLGRLTYEFRTADVLNGNRRIYPLPVFMAALDELQRRITKHQVFGNLDHPSIFDPESLIVRLSEAVVKIVEATTLEKSGKPADIKVVLDILDNPDGQRLASILAVEGNPGISQRAIARWREINDVERSTYKVPEGEFVRVAEFLRLITYDVVSEPGFADAQGAKVSESKGAVEMTLEELKAKHPALYQQVFTEGKTAGRTEALGEVEAKVASGLSAAVEAKRVEITAAATTKAQESVTKLQTDLDVTKKALEGLKPTMAKLGLVNEQMTDAGAATKIATLEAQHTETTRKLTEATEQLRVANLALTEATKIQGITEGLKAVNEAYKASPHRALIVTEVAKGNIADKAQALARAAEVAALIASVGGGRGTMPSPVAPAHDGLGIARSLGLVQPMQNGTSGGGGHSGDEDVSPLGNIGRALSAGIPML